MPTIKPSTQSDSGKELRDLDALMSIYVLTARLEKIIAKKEKTFAKKELRCPAAIKYLHVVSQADQVEVHTTDCRSTIGDSVSVVSGRRSKANNPKYTGYELQTGWTTFSPLTLLLDHDEELASRRLYNGRQFLTSSSRSRHDSSIFLSKRSA
ncbi:hypothetical protein CHS0354_018851 [Potamilus streckersoni]|uniref:Uncharacterized protein n=1 Tax=Potamilus streckersoni TaxID=2493646 RepID=A0AAE0SJH5_9BIVA|nr:hypothetical protein CHS0354_018851 [Potamilus streckersoni]